MLCLCRSDARRYAGGLFHLPSETTMPNDNAPNGLAPKDIAPGHIPASPQPIPHHLHRGEGLRCNVSGGARLYVAAGEVVLLAPPRLLAGEVHRLRSSLPAGHMYAVQETGWIELQALRPTTFLWLSHGEVSVAGRIKGILSAWLRAWRPRSARPGPPVAPATATHSTQSAQAIQAIQGANT
jgi:hypothetical protein